MSTEELTADLRIVIEGIGTPNERLLLRLYDAALARAEAAELAKRTEEAATNLAEQRRRAAETRLAEATALLPRFKTLTLMRSQDAGEVYDASSVDDIADELATALSATPAQAAEPDIDKPCPHPERDGRHELYVAHGQGYRHICRACGATDVPKAPEHPDTIALAECRAELEAVEAECNYQRTRAKDAERSRDVARAERDTALNDLDRAREELGMTLSQRDTALARIAELEAQVSEWAGRAGHNAGSEVLLENKIARAVAELEKMVAWYTKMGRAIPGGIRRALEALHNLKANLRVEQ